MSTNKKYCFMMLLFGVILVLVPVMWIDGGKKNAQSRFIFTAANETTLKTLVVEGAYGKINEPYKGKDPAVIAFYDTPLIGVSQKNLIRQFGMPLYMEDLYQGSYFPNKGASEKKPHIYSFSIYEYEDAYYIKVEYMLNKNVTKILQSLYEITDKDVAVRFLAAEKKDPYH